MRQRVLFTALLAASLVAAGCKPAAETESSSTAAPPAAGEADAPAVAGPTDVISEVDNAPAPRGLDVRAFAGTFGGTLPCADCPGIDATLELKPDGSYALHEVYRERDASNDSDGTWTAEQDGRRIRLDPNSKDAADRVYEVASDDELRMLGADGQPIESDLDFSLRRRIAAH